MTEEGPRRRRKLSAIMMADVCGFSRRMGENDERTVDLIQDFHRRVEQEVREFEGRVVDTAGDSVLGEFDSVVNAVNCARSIQQNLAVMNEGRPPEQHIATRIGVHLGDVIIEDYNVYGDGVNIAARLEPMADPGGICISEAVYQQVRDKLDVPVEDLGLKDLKNIQYPVRIFKIPPAAGTVSTPATTTSRRDVQAATVDPRGKPSSSESWPSELQRTSNLVLLIVGLGLLVSPIALFPSGGALPTGGAIVLGLVVGRIMARRIGSRAIRLGLGVGIACGALFTHWSHLTDVTFFLGGAIVAATAGGRRRERDERRRLKRERRGN